jgi:hypothetical protein
MEDPAVVHPGDVKTILLSNYSGDLYGRVDHVIRPKAVSR